MLSTKKNHTGFTLVELLIVIVVIAILAAISIVAYNGVQQRAEEAKLAVALDSYVKMFESYATIHGAYPVAGSSCLGTSDDYPAGNGFTAGACVMVNGTASSTVNSTLSTAFAEFSSSLPTVGLPAVSVTYYPSDVYVYRGVWMSSQADNYEFQYWLRGNRNCPQGSKSYNATADATRCNHAWGLYS